MSVPVKIAVASDFICPWCYIGERRLGSAIESLPDDIDVDVFWLPFELNPDMPVSGMDRSIYRSRKFGSWDYSKTLDAKSVEAGRTDGAVFDYDAIARTPNTFLAHRLALLARLEGKQSAYVAAVLKGYFAKGRDIGDPKELAAIASEIGIDRDAARAFLASDGGATEVRALEIFARDRGIRGVPHYEIGGIALHGAQPPEAIRRAILEAAAQAAVGSAHALSEGALP